MVGRGTSGRGRVADRVTRQPTPAHRLRHRPMQHDMHAAHPRRTQTLGLKRGVQRVAVAGGQPPQRHLTQSRHELVHDNAVPVGARRGRERGRGHELRQQFAHRRRRTTVHVAIRFDDKTLQRGPSLGLGSSERARQSRFCTRYCTRHRVGVRSDLKAPNRRSALGKGSCFRSRHAPKCRRFRAGFCTETHQNVRAVLSPQRRYQRKLWSG